MRHLFFLLCGLLASGAVLAQDTLHVFAGKGGGWNLHHKVKKGETIFQLARRYKAPPAMVAEANGLTYNDQLRENSTVSIPLGSYNLSSTAPRSKGAGHALVYVNREGEDLNAVSRQASVSKSLLQQWNRLRNETLGTGQRLFVGWVLVQAEADSGRKVYGCPDNVVNGAAAAHREVRPSTWHPDTDAVAAAPDSSALPPGEAQFREQTSDGANVVTERGAAVLFASSLRPSNGIYNGFFNGAQRGAIIEVRNLNNGKMVYVKVIGSLPATSQYHNASMGISSAAKSALGVTDERTLCQFRFAGY